jgi:hypothetical protein
MAQWLIDDSVDVGRIGSALAARDTATRGSSDPSAPGSELAVRLHDLVVHNNRKWLEFLGGADVRLDVVVVQGNVLEHDPSTCYAPTTLHFTGVGDGDALPVDDAGILVYYGWPKHFLDLSIVVSRDTKHGDDLSVLMAKATSDPTLKVAFGSLLGLVVAMPAAAAVTAAMTAAATIGNLAYQLVTAVCDRSIGLYRGNRLAFPDQFGIGRNPRSGAYRQQDLSFWYEVVESSAPPQVESTASDG